VAIPAWPISDKAQGQSYSESPQRNVAEGPSEIGLPQARKRSYMAINMLGWTTLPLGDADVDALFDFYHDDLEDGTAPFSMLHPRKRQLSIFRFTAEPKIAQVNGLYNKSLAIQAACLSTVQTETQTYLDAMTVAPTTETAFAYDNFIAGMKSTGLLAKSTDMRILGAHDEQAARLLVKSPSNDPLSYGGGMSASDFTAFKGFTGDGVGKYLVSARNYNTIVGQNDAAAFEWSLTDVASNGNDLGTVTNGNFGISPRMAANTITVKAHTTTPASPPSNSNSAGFFGWSRTGASAYTVYIDTVGTAETDASETVTASPTTWFRRGSNYSPRQLFWTGIFSPHLSPQNVTDLRRLVYTLGRQLGALT
jgi:hypothetical protein